RDSPWSRKGWNESTQRSSQPSAISQGLIGLLPLANDGRGAFAEGSCRGPRSDDGLLRRHLLDHGQHQPAVTVIQADRVASNLAEKTDFIVGKLGQIPGPVAMSGLGEELRERQLHGAGDLGQRVQRRDGMPVFYPREVAAQQSCALLDVTLGHAFLQPVVPDGLADVHRQSRQRKLPRMTCIVTRVVPSGKKNLIAPEMVTE